jgi:FkbM family methyltransferase
MVKVLRKIQNYHGKIRHYHSLLGLPGVAAFLFAKLSGTKPLFKKNFPSLKYPFYLRIGTTDASVCKQDLIERQYEFPLSIKPKVIVDAGANIGSSAVFFANKYPDSIIFALEPEESNFKLLEKNVSSYPQIKPIKAALWKENGQIYLVDPGDGNHGFQTTEKAADNCQPLGFIQALTLDALMTRMDLESVDVLKIDIEGAEKEVFESSAKWIDKVGVIMAELHDRTKAGCGKAFYEATRGFYGEFSKGEVVIRMRKMFHPLKCTTVVIKIPSASDS